MPRVQAACPLPYSACRVSESRTRDLMNLWSQDRHSNHYAAEPDEVLANVNSTVGNV